MKRRTRPDRHTLEVRLARNAAEIAAAQEVRYRVFYDELGARRTCSRR